MLEAFQTLIGTVKTRSIHGETRTIALVSNPHRYGQNGRAPPRGVVAHGPFQTLIGTVKTGSLAFPGAGRESQFQTLIGTVKTVSFIRVTSKSKLVSNPHRYGQNPFISTRHARFVPTRFQTLIGTVKTVPPPKCTGPRQRFQTLIGTVKTESHPETHAAHLRVSNPHRYGQNKSAEIPRAPNPNVSNPHRYGQNEFPHRRIVLQGGQFQTLIGTVKTVAQFIGPV